MHARTASEDRATEDGAAVGWGHLRKNPQITRDCGFVMGADFRLSTPARTRTLDPLIKSQLLYRLSYKGNGVPSGR